MNVHVPLITARNSSYGKVMFSQTCVIPSVHGGVGFPVCITGHMTRGSAWGGADPLEIHGILQVRSKAGGTHPTEMHSCFKIFLKYGKIEIVQKLVIISFVSW